MAVISTLKEPPCVDSRTERLTNPAESASLECKKTVRGEKKVQTTVYYSEEDQYLMNLVDQVARRERKSRSAVILSILEEYFERDKRLGEILVDMGFVQPHQIEEGLKRQSELSEHKPLGEILVEEGLVPTEAVERALAVQSRFRLS